MRYEVETSNDYVADCIHYIMVVVVYLDQSTTKPFLDPEELE